MACTCQEKINNVDNIVMYDDKIKYDKILNLEDMRYMSIDEIVNLYSNGYRIQTMQYGTYCTGSIVLDRSNTAPTGYFDFTLADALAQRFYPTSRCLKNVSVKLSTYPGNPANDMYIEIRKNDTSLNIPLGLPQTGNDLGHATIPYTSITSSLTEITVNLDILLTDTDRTNGLWLVLCLNSYDANTTDFNPYCITLQGANAVGNEDLAIKSYGQPWQKGCTNPCTGTLAMWFKTNKQTYQSPPTLNSISISPTTASVAVGSTQQFTASCKDQYNNNYTCPTLTWNSSNITKGTVNSSGLFTGVAAGTTNITANSGSITSNSATVTVTSPAPVLTTITLTPSTKSLSYGGTQTFVATCKDQNGSSMTCPGLTWTVDNTSIGSVTTSGVFTADNSAGTVVVKAQSGTVYGTATVTVTSPTPVLTTITLSPSSITLYQSGVQTFLATCKDQNGSSMTCPTLTWSVDNTSLGSITSSGVFTAGSTAGSTVVRATSGSISGTANVTISSQTPVLTTIIVSPSTASINIGGSRGFTATSKDQFGNEMTGVTISWTIDNSTIGNISPATGTTTTFTGTSIGTTIIRATSGSISGNSTVTVTTTPPPPTASGYTGLIAIVGIGLAGLLLLSRRKQ